MLYLLIIFSIVCGVVFWCKRNDLIYGDCDYSHHYCLYNKLRYHMYLSIILFIFFTVSAIVGTVIVCNSDFLNTTTEESSNTYQVTDFSAEKNTYNLIGDYEIKYSITVEDNFLIDVSSKNFGVEIICDNYNPTIVTVEESHCFNWWFLFPYNTFTYTLL